nr:CPPV073 semaphorin vaccinia A39R-like protein [Cooks petrelpox virus]
MAIIRNIEHTNKVFVFLVIIYFCNCHLEYSLFNLVNSSIIIVSWLHPSSEIHV